MVEKKEKSQSEIHKYHRKRVRKMFLQNGIPDNIPEHQLLEFLLFHTIPRKDTNPLAHRILDAFGGSLANVLEAPYNELMKVEGVTETTAGLIKFILPMAKRYTKEKTDTKNFIKNNSEAVSYLSLKFFSETVETVYLLCLDGRGKILDCPMLSKGDEISVGITARKVVEQVIRTGATSVMLAHNHPKGFPLPSVPDIEITSNISLALSNIGVKFLDHIIVGNGEVVSLANSKDYKYMF